MPGSFHRTNRSLCADNGLKSILAGCVAVAFVAAWTVWALKASVIRYEVSDSARLELNASAYPVQTSLAGRVIESRLTLGRQVQAGEILAELDSSAEQLSLNEERTRSASIEPQLEALRAQMRSEEAGRGDERRVLGLSKDAALDQYRQAEAQAVLVEQEAQRAIRLRSEGILSVADADRAQVEAKSKRASADNLKSAANRLEPEMQVRERDREVKLKQIAGDEAKLEADLAASAAAIRRLEYEIDRRRIRAPISGRLAECAVLNPGSHLTEGQQLGVILPSGKVQAVAEFAPASAMGKIHAGQRGILRLNGFPWAQYGTVSAHVARVASEIRDGKVRVELTVDSEQKLRIPIQHGLPGTLEIEIERTSPAALLLRSAGALAGAH